MKKSLLALALIVACFFITGCTNSTANNGATAEKPLITIKVGATPTPHAEILEVAKELLLDKGYDLQIVEFTDYVQPNLALHNYDLDANYFQHTPYLENFNANHGTDIVSAYLVHYEPFGLYPGKINTLENLPKGTSIAVPNDTTNEARALLLLESLGYIEIREGAGLEATVADIVSNPKELKVIELEAAQIPRSLGDVDLAIINGNYAIQSGLNVINDALAVESRESLAADTFANILAVRSGDESLESIKTLIDVLESDDVREFIENTYQGAVVPKF